MESKKAENPLGYKKISTLMAGFAIPSIVAMLVSSLYNIVDQIFIGQGVGYLGNAATTVAFPLTTICMAIALTCGIGTAARYSLYLGQKREEDAAKAVGNGICMMVLFGLVYIMNGMSNIARADGSPIYSMTSMVIGAVINTILDPIFIFVFDLGVQGAAWATVIGQMISCIYAALYLRRLKRTKINSRYFRLSLSQMGRTAAMGMSNGLTQISITLVQVVMNRSLVYYGAMTPYGSDIPLAGCGIVMKVNAIVLAVIIGIVQGMQPIIGFNYGAAKFDRVKKTYNLAVVCILAITVTGLFVFQVFPRQVLSIFGSGENEELYFEFSTMFMRTVLIFFPLAGFQIVSSNMFSAIGKPVKGTILSLTRQVIFFIPLVLILPVFWGLNGIMIAAPVSDGISFITVLIFIIREMKSMGKDGGYDKG